MRISQRLPPPRLLSIYLAAFRQKAAHPIAARVHASLRHLEEGIAAQDDTAIHDFDALVADAVARLRAARPTDWRRLLWYLDTAMYRDGEEMMDNPSLGFALRTHILNVLDRFNHHVGNYRIWADAAAPCIEATARTRRVRILEIAAGHGGFSIYLKTRFGSRVQVTASDIAEEYLAIGREQIQTTEVDVAFAVHDATHLSRVDSGDADLVVCTQSLHHFEPGMISRMLASAARVARVAVLFVDGERDPGPLLIMPVLMALYGRSWPVVHDTLVSVRRMYVAEELALIAHATPGLPPGTVIEYGRLPPGHSFILLRLEPCNNG